MDVYLIKVPVYYTMNSNKKIHDLAFCVCMCLTLVSFTLEVFAGNDVIAELTAFQYNKWENLDAIAIRVLARLGIPVADALRLA